MADAKKKIVSIQDIKQEKANKSKENRANGGADVVVDILSTHNVEFTEDFVMMKKGVTTRVSQLGYEFYLKNGVIKKID